MSTPTHPRRRAYAAVLALAVCLATPVAADADATPTGTTTTSPVTTTSAPTGSPTSTTSTPSKPPTPSTTTTGTTTTGTTTTTTTTSSPTAPTGTTSTSPTSGTPTGTPGLVTGGHAAKMGIAAVAGPTVSSDPSELAAGYLARELATGGNHFESFGYPDWGLTADGVLGLDAAGTGQTQAAASSADLATHVDDYITGEAYGDTGSAYAGATAKLLVIALAQGADPTAFGGVDLVATLQSLEAPSGQFTDESTFGDYSNTFGQSFAIMGLRKAGATPDAAALTFLRDQQCTDGGFRLYFGATPCTSDPDSTSLAVQALIAVNGTGDADAVRGLDFLAGRQGTDGGVGGGVLTEAANANSTGLAGQAFLAGGRKAQARLAASYVAALQYGCAFPAALRGGIAYDQAAYDSQKALGAKAAPVDQDRRSTAQAVLALAGTPVYAVTSAGATAVAPVADCPTTTPTTSAPATSTTTTGTATTGTASTATGTSSTTGAPGAGAVGGSTTSGAVAAGQDGPSTGSLAYTGATVLPLLLLAVLLLVAGGAAVLTTRRRGAHA